MGNDALLCMTFALLLTRAIDVHASQCPNNSFNGNSACNISPVNDLPGTQTDSVIDFNGENPGMYTSKPMCMP